MILVLFFSLGTEIDFSLSDADHQKQNKNSLTWLHLVELFKVSLSTFQVNKKYRCLEIDLDGLYKRMLLLKKKKYAAVKVQFKDGMPYEVYPLVHMNFSKLNSVFSFLLKY